MDLPKVGAAYDTISKLSVADRTKYLATLRMQDPELAHQLERLLEPVDDDWMRRSVARAARSLSRSIEP